MGTANHIPSPPDTGNFFFHPSFKRSLRFALRHSKNGKATWNDEIHAAMLKVASDPVVELLFELWKSCGPFGILSCVWKIVVLLPIHKKE